MWNRVLKIPRTQPHSDASALEVCNQLVQAGLGFLFDHCGCFDGADSGLGLLLGGVWERVYVVEDVCRFIDGERSSHEGGSGSICHERRRSEIPHLLEHVGLGLAGRSCRSGQIL